MVGEIKEMKTGIEISVLALTQRNLYGHGNSVLRCGSRMTVNGGGKKLVGFVVCGGWRERACAACGQKGSGEPAGREPGGC